MNCLDCLDGEQLAAPAVAVCTGCGAAICRDHLVLSQRRRVRIGTMGRQEPVDPPTRTARCRLCQAAEHGITTLVAEPLRLPWRAVRRERRRGDRSAQ